MNPTWKATGRGTKEWYILHPHHAAIVNEVVGVDEVELLKHPMLLDAWPCKGGMNRPYDLGQFRASRTGLHTW
jgi:hypothetical protein